VTGLANAAPRRVSILPPNAPTFSPDGRSIAFSTATTRPGTNSNLVVIPVNGGPERVVAETQGDIWPITWRQPDSIYFGLSFGDKENLSKSGVYRVGITGGKPQFVIRTAEWGGYPGLSKDGRFILGYDSTWDSVIVATPSGRQVFAYEATAGLPTPDVWSVGGTTVGSNPEIIRAARVLSLADGHERAVSDSSELQGSIWSPDEKRVAAWRWNPGSIVISDVATGTRRSIPVEPAPGRYLAIHWSPDGKYIAYRDGNGGIHLLDLATSKVRRLAANTCNGPIARWRSDSRAILYGVVDPAGSTDAISKIDIHEIALDGQDRTMGFIQARCRGANFNGKIIDDSLAVAWGNNEYRITNFRAARESATRFDYKRDGTPQEMVPTLSTNGRWLAIRRQSASDHRWSIELMHPDGSAHKSVSLSFPIMPGGTNPWIRDDGTELIVASGDCGNRGCSGGITVYKVDVATGQSTALASIPQTNVFLNDMEIAADGRSMLYLRDIETRRGFYEFDFTALLKGAQP